MTLEDARIVAEDLRRRRRDLVAAIAGGELGPAALAADQRSADVKVVVLAEVVPGVGKVQARRILAGVGVAASTRWGDLAPEQVGPLVDALTSAGAPPATAP